MELLHMNPPELPKCFVCFVRWPRSDHNKQRNKETKKQRNKETNKQTNPQHQKKYIPHILTLSVTILSIKYWYPTNKFIVYKPVCPVQDSFPNLPSFIAAIPGIRTQLPPHMKVTGEMMEDTKEMNKHAWDNQKTPSIKKWIIEGWPSFCLTKFSVKKSCTNYNNLAKTWDGWYHQGSHSNHPKQWNLQNLSILVMEAYNEAFPRWCSSVEKVYAQNEQQPMPGAKTCLFWRSFDMPVVLPSCGNVLSRQRSTCWQIHPLNPFKQAWAWFGLIDYIGLYMSTSVAQLHMLEHVGNDCFKLHAFLKRVIISSYPNSHTLLSHQFI